tara:strand:+ start:3298 stop:3591 length:294 start_codon:yes stop_codon:yes gene_type:complete
MSDKPPTDDCRICGKTFPIQSGGEIKIVTCSDSCSRELSIAYDRKQLELEAEERLRGSAHCTHPFEGDWYLQKDYWNGIGRFIPGWKEHENNRHLKQ